jgi:hypothetical protein
VIPTAKSATSESPRMNHRHIHRSLRTCRQVQLDAKRVARRTLCQTIGLRSQARCDRLPFERLTNVTRLGSVSAAVTLEPWGSGDLPTLSLAGAGLVILSDASRRISHFNTQRTTGNLRVG